MKKFGFFAILIAAAAFTACSNSDDERQSVTLTFEGSAWASCVASHFNNSYSGGVANENYTWKDEQTSLTSPMLFSSYGTTKFFTGGWIVSSYNSKDLAAFGDYTHDLYVYNASNADAVKGGGHNGSDNFLVGFGNADDYGDNRPALVFSDGVPRLVKGCYVNSTCYFKNIAENGNYAAAALGDNDEVKIHATGYDAAGAQTGVVTMSFAKKGKIITSWTAWDLSALGEVVKVCFSMSGGPTTDYGMTMPTYYAVDDISVEW